METYLKSLISHSPAKMITYEEFMDAVLYHPKKGYYMKNTEKIGPNGDFITTSNVSDIFGRIFARWFMKKVKEHSLKTSVCEVGGGNGRFAKAFIEEWKAHSELPLTYIIVESSPFHRKLQREQLSGYDFFQQANSIKDIQGTEGLIFSNELFDALPVRVVEKEGGRLFEVMIGIKNEGFCELKVPVSDPKILKYLSESAIVLKENQRLEVPLAMDLMIRDIGNVLNRGFVVTVDYGYTDAEWMEPYHRDGSLRGYYKHKMVKNVLQNPGEMDITTHIHFDRLVKQGEAHSLRFISKQRQDEFLLAEGILEELQEHYDPNPFSERSKRNRAIRSLIMPSGMSEYFHILIQEKK